MFMYGVFSNDGNFELYENNSERPVDALAVRKGESLTDSVSDNLKSRDASASKKNLPQTKALSPVP